MADENKVVEIKGELSLPEKDWTKELKLVKEMTAAKCNETEFKLLCFMAQEYKLNPLLKEIWAIKWQEHKPALIFCSRDGLISIAHRSGQFGSMKTTCEIDEKTKIPVSATCTIWRKDYDKPFENTVYYKEYNTRQSLWLTKPRVMLMKVAESTCLRRAFSISGFYTPEEIHKDETAKGMDKSKEVKEGEVDDKGDNKGTN